jgi:N-acetylmuramoyl-L-alanine amidase
MPYTGDEVAPSPNHGVRRTPFIAGIVLHATEDGGNEFRALAWMRSPKSRVSCHLLVGRDGHVTRLVGDQQRAWHAGASRWRGTRDVNSITLAIEIANRNDGEPFTDAQYTRVAEIVAHYCRQGISLDDVVSHAMVAPGRKRDPFGWDWERFHALVNEQLRPVEIPVLSDFTALPPRIKHGVAIAPNAIAPDASVPARRPAVYTSAKPVMHSRTFWLNILTVLAAAGAIAGQMLDLAFWVGLPLPEEVIMWALFCVGALNILLRFSTTRPLCMTPARERTNTTRA